MLKDTHLIIAILTSINGTDSIKISYCCGDLLMIELSIQTELFGSQTPDLGSAKIRNVFVWACPADLQYFTALNYQMKGSFCSPGCRPTDSKLNK